MKNPVILSVTLLLTAAQSPAQAEYKGVAPIFHARWISCKNDNGIGPFPLTGYSETIAFASLIEDAVDEGHMRSCPPDTAYTRFMG